MPAPVMFDLDGRVAIVTGGNGGIGRGIAIGLASAGAVGILARNEEKNRAVLEELLAIGSRAHAIRLDVTDRAALKPAFEEVERELGPVSILAQ